VDFNCLFEKVGFRPAFIIVPDRCLPCFQGKTLETPERVPFRLTQNLIDGLGVTGVEGINNEVALCDRDLTACSPGVFRVACENTMQLLRDNKDTLMTVLDAFIHDPLVEWEDEKRKLVCLALRFPWLCMVATDCTHRNGKRRNATQSSRRSTFRCWLKMRSVPY